jgi:hypothetical protein
VADASRVSSRRQPAAAFASVFFRAILFLAHAPRSRREKKGTPLTYSRRATHSAARPSRHSRTRRGPEALEPRLVFAATPAPSFGVNLDQVVDWGSAWTFTDAFIASRDWLTASYNTSTGLESPTGGGTASVDDKGWPTQLQTWTQNGQTIQQRLWTLMYRNIGGNYPAGIYTAQWRGTGSVTFGFDASVIASGDNPDGSHWAKLNVTPTDQGIQFKINSMPLVDADPNDSIPPAVDPIRDVHVWVPDYNGQSFVGQIWQPGVSFSPFHPLFLERLQQFKTLRFMDWMKTNVGRDQHWSDMRPWDYATQSGAGGDGVSIEYMVELANETGSDMWVNMPYAADDDYVRNFATYVRDHLNSNLKANVEWSNEIWNSIFATYPWITQQLTLPENAGLTRYQFAAGQIKQDFDIWSDVFSGQTNRLIRVVAGQAANPTGVTEDLLKNMDGKFDAVACTGYFGLSAGQRAGFSSSTTSTDIVKAVMANVPSAISSLANVKALGVKYGGGRAIKTYAYESGQHADGQNNAGLSYLNALYAAQTDPMMYEAYDDFVRGFYDISGDLAMHFTYVSRNDASGSWGALQTQNQDLNSAPKYESLTEAINGTAFYPEYTVTPTQAAGDEFGQQPVTFTVTRSGDKPLAQNVAFLLGGTAIPGADYANPGSTIHFAAGQATALLTITPVNDTTLENSETVTVTLQGGNGYKIDNLATRTTASGTIADDDGSINYALPIVNPGFESGNLNGWTKLLPTPITPTNGTNIIAVAPTSPGATVINAPPPPEGAKFAWAGGSGGSGQGGAFVQALAQTFDLSAHAAGIDGGAAKLTFSGYGNGFDGDIARLEVRYFDAAGAAIGSPLLSANANTNGVWTKLTDATTVPVGARSVELRAVMSRSGANTTDAGVDGMSARLTYAASETVNITTTDPSASEPGTDTAKFTVTRSGAVNLAQPLTVSYDFLGTAAPGRDFLPLSGSVTIPAGQTSADIIVTPVDDAVDEPDESLTLMLSGRSQYVLGTSTFATATIHDNDPPGVTISATTPIAMEGGPQYATFVVERLSQYTDKPLTVKYAVGGDATSGSDYQPLSGSITIAAGQTQAFITLVPVDDDTVEHDESVTITLTPDPAYTITTPGGGTTGSASAMITNNDFPHVTVTATSAATETEPATFIFTRTGELLGDDLNVYFDAAAGGTAIQGEDYTLGVTGVTIPAGQLSAKLSIAPVAGTSVPGGKTVTLNLAPGAGYAAGSPASATATLDDSKAAQAPEPTPVPIPMPTPIGDAAPTVTKVFVSGTQWSPSFKNYLASNRLGDAKFGFAIPSNDQLNELPWTNIDQVSLRFSQAADVQSGDLVIRGVRVPSYAIKSFAMDSATLTATWTLAAPVANDKLILNLDGELGFRFNVLPGDVTRSGKVDRSDDTALKKLTNVATTSTKYVVWDDVNGSGVIDSTDVLLIQSREVTTLPSGTPE